MKEIQRLHEHEISIAGLFGRKLITQEKGYTLVPSPPQSACQISRNIFLEHASVVGQGLHLRLTTLTLNSLSSLGGFILLTLYIGPNLSRKETHWQAIRHRTTCMSTTGRI
jgi:hypothetical protein